MATILPIETTLSGMALFEKFVIRPYAFFLDSSMNPKGLGNFSFMGANPYLIFKSKESEVSLWQKNTWETLHVDPLQKLQECIQEASQEMLPDSPIPFLSGAVGYIAYDSYPLFEPVVPSKPNALQLPDIFFGFYDGVLAIDNRTQEVFAIASEVRRPTQEILDELQSIITSSEPSEVVSKNHFGSNTYSSEAPLQFYSNFKKDDYLQTIGRAKEHIAKGDIYQVNLSQQFHCFSKAAPKTVLEILRTHFPAPFGGYLDCGSFQIVSNSPERFFKTQEGHIQTRPIKGTRPRGSSPKEDTQLKEALAQSEKEKAELLMIVDLERNDLSKIAVTGSVEVKELFAIETYPTVFHLVSTIQAQLKKDVSPIDCFRALFPGGSITGAPKIRSMQIIDALEPTRRGIYTGAMGYFSINGNMDFNIAIRTLVHQNGRYTFGVGGGIVWDSIDTEEYEETFHKARALMEAIQQAEAKERKAID